MITPVSVSARRHLRSAGQGMIVPWTRTAGFGPRSFPVAAPVEQSAAGNEDDISDTRTELLEPTEN